MNAEEFRRCGYEMIDYVADFRDNIEKRQPLADVKPGFLNMLLEQSRKSRAVSKTQLQPKKPTTFEALMKDVDSSIIRGSTHWQHPNFLAYYPSGNSWPSILANILCNGVAVNSATWLACPAATELEIIVLDWIAKFLGIPDFYLSKFSNPKSKGGGAIEASSCETVLLALVSAREHAIKKLSQKYKNVSRTELKGKLVCYCNSITSPSLEKAAVTVAGVKLRQLEPEADGRLSAETLYTAIKEDMAKELVPFFMSANLGSGAITSFDDLVELGPICEAFNIWLHADADYAGSCFCCSEFKYLTRGLQFTQSMSIDCSKWMLATTSTSILWVKYKNLLTGPLGGFGQRKSSPVEEYQHWGISTTRSFRGLQLWMVIRSYGMSGIRSYIRNHCVLAKHFENHVLRDDRFQIVGETRFGVCCFAYKGTSDASNCLTQRLLEGLNSSRKIFLIPAKFQHKFFIRFSVCFENATRQHIDHAWSLIKDYAGVINRLYPLETKTVSKEIEKTEGLKVNFMLTSSLRPEGRQIWNELRSYYITACDGPPSLTKPERLNHNLQNQNQKHNNLDSAVYMSSLAQDIVQTFSSLHSKDSNSNNEPPHENLSEEIDKIFSKLENALKIQASKIQDAEKVLQDVRANTTNANTDPDQASSSTAAESENSSQKEIFKLH